MTNKTPNLFFIILLLMVFMTDGQIKAQSIDPGKLRFGIGLDGLVPVGNTGTYQHFGLGITPQLQYSVFNKLAFTFTSGIYHFFPKTITYPTYSGFSAYTSKSKSDVIPAKAGAKFFIGRTFYIAAEAGAGFEVAEGGGPIHFLWSPGIGYASERWDIGARYENFSGHSYSDGVAAVRVAYGFGL